MFAVRALRESMGLTLSEMGKELGLDRMTVHRYEKGIYDIASKHVLLTKLAVMSVERDRDDLAAMFLGPICSALGVTPHCLLASMRRAA